VKYGALSLGRKRRFGTGIVDSVAQGEPMSRSEPTRKSLGSAATRSGLMVFSMTLSLAGRS
jgi:hypothetical protein